MLMEAAKVNSCEEYEKCTPLLLDEMHIRNDLVYDKHDGKLVGFVDLGEVNNHLLAFERSLTDDSSHPEATLASTMMIFMVRGLFTNLQFQYDTSHLQN